MRSRVTRIRIPGLATVLTLRSRIAPRAHRARRTMTVRQAKNVAQTGTVRLRKICVVVVIRSSYTMMPDSGSKNAVRFEILLLDEQVDVLQARNVTSLLRRTSDV